MHSLEHLWHLYRLGRYSLVQEQLDNVLQGVPSHVEALALSGMVHSKLGNHEAARQTLLVAMALDPENDWLHAVMATIRFDINITDSRQWIRQAIELNPSEARHYAMLADSYRSTQEWDGAHYYLLKSLKLDPDDIQALIIYGLLKFNQQLVGEAELIFQHVLTREPENTVSHEYLGKQRLSNFDTIEAMEHFKHALRVDPLSLSAQHGLESAEYYHSNLNNKLYSQIEHWIENRTATKQCDFQSVSELFERDLLIYCEEPQEVQFSPQEKQQTSLEIFDSKPFVFEIEESHTQTELPHNGVILVLKIIGYTLLAMVILCIVCVVLNELQLLK